MAVLFRDAALADARSPRLRLGVNLLVKDGRIAWIREADDAEDPGDAEVVDASGATIVPGMVDAHSHLTMPGGAHWIDRGFDPTDVLISCGEANARLMMSAGVRWARDVGAPRRNDPHDGKDRALSLGLRDRWHGHREYPYVRAAGTWLTKQATLPTGLSVEAATGDELLAASVAQLDDGADFVKLYLDGPDRETPPWSVHEVGAVVEAAHARGAKVTAHSTRAHGARVCAQAGVDSIEHGFDIDSETAVLMADRGIALVSTLIVLRSFQTFGKTTTLGRFTGPDSQDQLRERWDSARQTVKRCHDAGVAIAAGTDFGGGSTRANHLAWEVESLVEAGLEPWQALAAATWRGGELLGEPAAGAIREGGPADFFLVHGDPLSDPSALWRVWRIAY